MRISSRNPEGEPNQCPICDSKIFIEPYQPFGDAPCPACGQLLWFVRRHNDLIFYDSIAAELRMTRMREIIAQQLGIALDKIPEDLNEFIAADLEADSLDLVELVMELEEEFDN